MARSVAEQALDADRRDKTVACKPADPTKGDPKCAARFLRDYGALLFRRPLRDEEVEVRVALANEAAAEAKDFYRGLELPLVTLLTAPDFLFRFERTEPDPKNPGERRLDGYSKASRLSFLLWDSGPDAQLLAAAKKGELDTERGLKRELSRMIQSPRLEEGLRGFFEDMLQLDALSEAIKDTTAYPIFSPALMDSAREETLRSLVDYLLKQNGDYRGIFTTRTTMINRHLAALYDLPFLASGEEWIRYAFPEGSGRSGVLTQASFLSSFAHPAASSPTRRGVKVNEIFRCSPTPDPPADVDFTAVQALEHGTVRQRLMVHMENDGCRACHRASDPVGLTLEQFDGIGQRRAMENGVPIDVSAELGGKKFNGAPGLGELLAENARVPECLVKQMVAYGVGRPVGDEQDAAIDSLAEDFAANGYHIKDLLYEIGASGDLFKIAATPQKAAAINSVNGQGDGQ
ncbi:MAG: DUF1592 domain-containing protein [Amphiplicatus sp.]